MIFLLIVTSVASLYFYSGNLIQPNTLVNIVSPENINPVCLLAYLSLQCGGGGGGVILPSTVTISFATNTGTGSIVFSGSAYASGQTGSYALGNYAISANPPTGYLFWQWVSSASLSVRNAMSSATNVTVSGSGSLEARFTLKPGPSVANVTTYVVTSFPVGGSPGAIYFNSTFWGNGTSQNLPYGSDPIFAAFPPKYTFAGWTSTGGVTVKSPSSTDTSVTIAGSGALMLSLVPPSHPTPLPAGVTFTSSSAAPIYWGDAYHWNWAKSDPGSKYNVNLSSLAPGSTSVSLQIIFNTPDGNLQGYTTASIPMTQESKDYWSAPLPITVPHHGDVDMKISATPSGYVAHDTLWSVDASGTVFDASGNDSFASAQVQLLYCRIRALSDFCGTPTSAQYYNPPKPLPELTNSSGKSVGSFGWDLSPAGWWKITATANGYTGHTALWVDAPLDHLQIKLTTHVLAFKPGNIVWVSIILGTLLLFFKVIPRQLKRKYSHLMSPLS